ncbi:MAG: CdaR family protein [Tenericutes bacterium]|nr:CdaR family protein [Mycoplasmatota bacterium]
MKKISKKIILFFDKWLITPITKFILFITDFIKNNGREIEKFINKKQTLIVLSLVFAFLVFFIVDQNSDTILNKSAEVLYNQPVTAEYNEEAYVIEGLPTSVDVTLIGRTSDLYLARQYTSNLSVSVDLRGLTPGSHKVKLNYTQGLKALKSIDYKIDPSTANIVVYEKVSETRELDYDILHKDKLDTTLVLDSVDLSRNDVIIKGASYKLKQVATVKALVDIENISNPKAGTFTLKEIPLIAYDSDGKPVEGIEIVPTSINAQVKITSPSKEVPLQVIPSGEVAFGKSIKEFSTSIAKVTIYGDESVINDIESIPVKIDVTNLSSDKTFKVNIEKPAGVRNISSKTVTVKVSMDEVITKDFTDCNISIVNLNSNYKAYAVSKEDSSVTVVVKGSSDVVNALDPNTIQATVDLTGYGPGEYEVEVKVTGNDLKLTYESKTKKVKIKIEQK